MTVSEALPDAMAAANKISDDNDWGAMDRRLVFRDNDLEWDFRVTERSRNLGQARFVLWLALGIELSFAAIDPWTLPADGMTFVLWRTIILTLALVALLGLTYAPFFRTRWPLLMTLAVHVMTVANGLTNAMVDVPVLYLAGFMLLVLASYLIVPLIFQYCIGTVTTASLVYLGITALGDVADAQLLAMLAAQLVAANVIGIAALYLAERFRRLDHGPADAILHTGERIEEFALEQHGGVDAFGDFVKPDERSAADGLHDVVVDFTHDWKVVRAD